MSHRVTFIPGDGTGPELAEATKRVLEATGVEFEWDFQDAGVDVYEEEGNPLPDRTLDSIRERGIAIKGPTTTPVGSDIAPSTSRSARSSTSTPASGPARPTRASGRASRRRTS
jgi:isocitrate/isopropylmalate dehydrogenase